MRLFQQHLARCFIAGIVALLPIAGIVLGIVYFEVQLSGSWLKDQGFYFFGMGLLFTLISIYLVGFVVSTFIGQLAWRVVDRLLNRLPILGNLYQTLKQLLGYGEGPNAFFQRVVFVHNRELDADQIGLVTREANEATQGHLAVFVPFAPTPTSGRLIFVEASKVRPAGMTVNEAMKWLVSIGSGFGEDSQLSLAKPGDSTTPAPDASSAQPPANSGE